MEKEIKKPAIKKAKKNPARTEVFASLNFTRLSAKKARLIINQLKGLDAQNALNYLPFIKKSGSLPIAKLLNSAIANATNNFQLDKKYLFIKKFIANEGPVLKRWQPKAHGRATSLRKQTCHLELVLGVKPEGLARSLKKESKTDENKEEVKVIDPQAVKKDSRHGPSQGGSGQGKENKGFMRGIFQRKTG
jgi:large subunit ribosomal protein L22